MTTETIIAIVSLVVIVILVGLAIYMYLKNTSLEQIRYDVYQLFLKAEHEFTETKSGKQKLEWVVQKARSLLPSWARLIISEEMLYIVIDEWFDAVKDLLDDGKINKSVENE